jgi:hypothetical protein
MVRSSASATLGKCTILTFVGKTVGNSWPWTDGLAQNTIIAATTVAHASRVSWRTPILRKSTTNEKHFVFTGLFLVSAKMTARFYVARAMRASG